MPPDSTPIQWLMATQSRGVHPGLKRMERLLEGLGNPEKKLRCLHVAGTNGKGSVCAFAESVLRVARHRTGLYTSPHLVEFSERIRIDGVNAASSDIDAGIRRLQDTISGWGEENEPTFFELVTALAFDLFARAGCDIVVLETGLGGRLDATNTAPKLACAITPIALDHTEWLGGTLGEIAREKAGIFRSGVPSVIAPQEPEVEAALAQVAREKVAPLTHVREPLPANIPLGIAGSCQRWNAALALALIRAAGFFPSAEAVAKGLFEVFWPGRFQRLSADGAELILDGAHNLHAVRQLAAIWREEYGERRCRLVFGALTDKDPSALLNELIPLASEIVLVPVASPRSADPADLAARISKSPGSGKAEWPVVHISDSLRGALVDNLTARPTMGTASETPILLAGSLFLVGEALALLSGGEAIPRSQ